MSNFGTKTTASAFGSSNTLSFGAAPATSQFSFGTNTQQQQQSQQQPGLQFGSTFNKPTGSVAPQPTGFSFGAPTSTPSGFGFGATTASAAPAGTGLTFGATSASTAAPTGFGFGTGVTSAAPNASIPNSIGFGAPQTTATNLTIGTPATTSGLNFGTPASSTVGFTLGTGTPATTGFGATVIPSTGLSLGAPLSTASTGFTLGGTSSTAASTTTSFSLGGLTASTASTPSLNFGTSTTGSILTSTPSTGLTFGATSTAPTLNFGLSTSTSAAPTGLSFGTLPASTGFSLTTPTTSAATASEKVGLGGIQTSTAASLGTTTAKEIPPKEQQVPNEIQQDIESFKNYIKQQKLYSSDVSRCCVKDFRSVEAQIGVLSNVIKEIESQLQRNRSLAEKLKYDTAQGLQLLEMAQRTQDTPGGLQYENVAPMNFFLSLADKFEKEMQALKIQIENTDKYVKNFGQPATLTSQDLSLGMKRLHDTFVALAGRLQSVHTQVESQKELYTNLRKQLANDFSNPFESLDKKLNPNQTIPTPMMHSPPKIACGPTPFNQIMTSNFPITSQQNIGSPYPGMSSVTSGFGMGSSTLPSLFGNMSGLSKSNPGFQNMTSSFQNPGSSTNFQLQKPPTGNKRGKQ